MWIQDWRFALRILARRPGFSLLVILVLGLGLGAATAVVDLANVVAWRPVPVPDPGEIVKVFTANHQGFIGPYHATSYLDYVDYQRAARSLAGLTASHSDRLRLDDGEATDYVTATAVSGNFFEVLRLEAAAGRLLNESDDVAGVAPALVLGHRLWLRLGGGPGVLGSTFRLEGLPFTVVGVAPEGFHGTTAGRTSDVFFPLASLPEVLGDSGRWFLEDREVPRMGLVGRLRPGVTREAARAELDVLARQLDADHPRAPKGEASAGVPRRITVTGGIFASPIDLERLTPSLSIFAAAVTLLLVITCANVAHLLLARAASRRREMAVRQSIGADPALLVRQLLTEGLVLALGGAACGLVLARWARAFVAVYAGPELAEEMRFDGRVLGTSLLVCLAATLIFGLAPALAAARVDLVEALKGGAAGGGRRRFTAGQLLSAAQVALSVVLLATGALLTVSLANRLHADRGFDADHLLMTRLDLPDNEYGRDAGNEFLHRFRDRAAALPEVRSAGLSLLMPPTVYDVKLPLTLPEAPEEEHHTRFNFVDAHYFATLGVELQEGRLFDSRDAPSNEDASVIVNRLLAEKLWPAEDPVGRRFHVQNSRPHDPGPGAVVVGVVGNVSQYRTAEGAEPVLYFAAAQRYRSNMQLVLRSTAEPAAAFGALRGILREMNPGLALRSTATWQESRRDSLTLERLQTQAVAVFAALGFLLAVLGLFGVLSYAVSCRVREMGIRQALGARRRDILGQVLGQGARVASAGIAAGLLGTFFASKLLRSLLYGVGTGDVRILAAVVLTVLAAALGAAYLPARRAAALDPLRALRHE